MSDRLIIRDVTAVAELEPVTGETLATKIIRLHTEIRDASRMTLEKAFLAGELLAEKKSEVEYGNWLQWCSENIPQVPERSVQRYIQLFENKDWLIENYKTDTVSDLPVGIRRALEAIQDRDKPKGEVTTTQLPADVAIEADEIRPPVPSWAYPPINPVPCPNPTNDRKPEPPGRATAPLPEPPGVKSVPPLSDSDKEKIEGMTSDFSQTLMEEFHFLDRLNVLDLTISTLRNIRREEKG